ncbi:hypothetical protein BSG1_02655 [Bacillus sp. SG-1]|nr:hypothetical protein BSG1_02655 [Bacillus sp. SG-1]
MISVESEVLKGKLVKFQRGPATVNWEQAVINHCTNVWEGTASNDHKPGDLPVTAAPQAYEDREV